MIHLPLKDKTAPPNRLSVVGALRQIKKAVSKVDGEVYNHSYYPHNLVTDLLRAYSIHKRVLEDGDQPKCNYCESQGEKLVTLQVEHYRPKAKVEAIDNAGIEHPGYYWLGLEWTNLLLSCPKCNGKSAKGNRFPIRGVRANPLQPVATVDRVLSLDRSACYADDNPLLAEGAILLNPEIDHPENFLIFDNQASLSGYGEDPERGELSKDIYNLNRGPLRVDRIKIWIKFKKQIVETIAGHQLDRINEDALHFIFRKISQDVIDRKSPAEEFTLFGRYLNDNIGLFISEIDVYYQDRFLRAYQEVLAEQPAP